MNPVLTHDCLVLSCRFREIGEVYRVVAEDTVLGSEQIGQRKRGTTVEDVVAAVREGMATKEKVE
jgi:hypothetical protein